VLNVVDIQAAGGAFSAGGLEKEFLERLDARGQEAVDSVADEIEESAPDLTVETAVERTTSFEGAAAGVREYVEENGGRSRRNGFARSVESQASASR
jgi:hypothetical protein